MGRRQMAKLHLSAAMTLGLQILGYLGAAALLIVFVAWLVVRIFLSALGS